jgi:hypothetical protein
MIQPTRIPKMATIKMIAPNPDTNGVNVQGYDRIERNKKDGYFYVHDSNLAAKLRETPWFFTDAPSAPADKSPAKKAEVEDKKLEEMSRDDLVAWLTERGHKPGPDVPDADLLAAAILVKEEADKKAGKKK